MNRSNKLYSLDKIPDVMKPHFQEYDTANLDLERDSNLVIQRTLEFGDWEEVRWLFRLYGKRRISDYMRQYGERGLSPVVFTYWRKLLGLRKWRKAPFSQLRNELWNP
jgi:hypothetical protein